MKIADRKVVGIEYTLKNSAGEVVDTNVGEELLHFIQGLGNIVPGLERAMDGRSQDDRFEISVKSVDGYGDYDQKLVRRVPKAKLKKMGDVKEGMMLQISGPEGAQVVTVTEVTDDEVVMDGNHPLAGQDLHFTIRIAEIRDASAEELQHGHAHGPGGHHHH